MNLHLGCGSNYMPGWINIDFDKRNRADQFIDLNNGLPYIDNCCEEILAHHVLEHLNDLIFIMKEVHRVLKPTGFVMITVPHWQHPFAFGDPSHKRYFNENTFECFVQGATGRVIGIDFFFKKLEGHVANNEIYIKLQPIK